MRITHVTAAALAAVGAAASQAEIVYGVTNNQTLVRFDSASPGTLLSGTAISGLQQNERVMGIDFRPATGQLYALGSFSRLYTINLGTGAASLVGALTSPLNGSSFGFDFNPTIDRIRVVSDADQNLVLNPDTAATTVTTPLFYTAGDPNNGRNPNVLGSAYDNNFQGATTSQLYGIDTGLDVLVRQANSAGTLTTVGPLGADLTDQVGFDISGATNTAFASVVDAGGQNRSTFWTISLQTGQAMMIGEIGGGAVVTSIAVVPGPGAAALLGVAGLLGARRRR